MLFRFAAKVFEYTTLPKSLHVIPAFDLAVSDRIPQAISFLLEGLVADEEIQVINLRLARHRILIVPTHRNYSWHNVTWLGITSITHLCVSRAIVNNNRRSLHLYRRSQKLGKSGSFAANFQSQRTNPDPSAVLNRSEK